MADILILDCGDDIKGECLLDGYKNKIELTSYNHGIGQPITTDTSNTKRTQGKAQHMDFSVSKYLDLASCTLIDRCNQGTVIPTVKIIVGQTDQDKVTPLIIYELSDALISSINHGGGGGKPNESLAFNYTKIKWDYTAQKSDATDAGKKSAKWSLLSNKAE